MPKRYRGFGGKLKDIYWQANGIVDYAVKDDFCGKSLEKLGIFGSYCILHKFFGNGKSRTPKNNRFFRNLKRISKLAQKKNGLLDLSSTFLHQDPREWNITFQLTAYQLDDIEKVLAATSNGEKDLKYISLSNRTPACKFEQNVQNVNHFLNCISLMKKIVEKSSCEKTKKQFRTIFPNSFS